MAPRPGSAPGRARACRHSDRSITLRALHAGTAGQRVIRRAGDDRRARHRRGRSKRVRRRGRAHGRPRGAGRLPDHRRGDDARQQTPRAMPARAPGPPMNAKGPGNRAQRSTATGIRTRVSAVRGRRPGPLDDIAIAANRCLGRLSHGFLFSHATLALRKQSSRAVLS